MRHVGVQLDLIGGYGREVLRGLMQYAYLVGGWDFLMPGMYASERDGEVWERGADGVVAMVHDAETLHAIRSKGVAVVNVAHTLDIQTLADLQLPTVIPDDREVGRQAYEYLHDRGFRSFGFCGHPHAAWSLTRQQGFVDAATADGLPCSCTTSVDEVDKDWVASLGRSVGVLAANDRYAWYAISVCREIGRRVPEDLAVLGVDNDVLLDDLVKPTLSSMKPAAFQVGIEAGRLLSALMDGGRPPAKPILLPPDGVVTRNSTDVLMLEDDTVVSAMRYIRLNADKPISVVDVQREVLVSRRNLERRFRVAIGRSILQEIRRARIERACELLRDTDFDMQLIAERCGFQNQVRFSTVFRQLMATSPSNYRKNHRATR